MEIYFKDEPQQNHEMFFSYDLKKEKSISGRNETYPCVVFKNLNRRSGKLKVVCVDNEPVKNGFTFQQYRLHRHKLVDYSNKTEFCDEFGVATFNFKATEDTKVEILLENLSIRRTKEALTDLEIKCSLNKIKKFDPFGIGFGDLKKKVDLNCVRLCCQVIFDDKKKSLAIVSDKIQNCKSEIKVHEWINSTETQANGGDKFYVFISELKSDHRDIYAIFVDEFEQEFARVKPDYVHSNRALRFTVPKYPRYLNNKVKISICCKFFLAVLNRNYKSDLLSFHYITGCSCELSSNDYNPVGRDIIEVQSRSNDFNSEHSNLSGFNLMEILNDIDFDSFLSDETVASILYSTEELRS